jgi:pantoate--beta-alanine ligase
MSRPARQASSTALQVLTTAEAMRAWSRRVRAAGERLALVPTMGALHAGHRSLFKAAAGAADRVVASVFVNPAQFGEQADLDRYPRQLETDLAICAADGVAAVYAPDLTAVYAPDHSTWVVEEALAEPLEGASRPGHFRGVLTIVLKLFTAAEPDLAVFGQKDLQQALLIRRMVRDLGLPVEIRVAPTVRDADGVALSSRNTFLTPDQREQARSLSRALHAGLESLAAGETDPTTVREAGLRILKSTRGPAVDYLELVDLETLRRPDRVQGPVALAGAVRIGEIRLIDNAIYPPGALAGLSAGAPGS